MNPIRIKQINKDNWEEAAALTLHETQLKLVPSVIDSLAVSFTKPWDEGFDPYILYLDDTAIGFFFLSYIPHSTDNYWIGGFQIDKEHQGRGLGNQSLEKIIAFIQEKHTQCEIISLSLDKNNMPARKLYEKFGFIRQEIESHDGQHIYKLKCRCRR